MYARSWRFGIWRDAQVVDLVRSRQPSLQMPVVHQSFASLKCTARATYDKTLSHCEYNCQFELYMIYLCNIIMRQSDINQLPIFLFMIFFTK